MPKLKLYALTLIAKGPPDESPVTIAAKPAACKALNLGQARSKGLIMARDTFLAEKGWFEWDARATEITAELVEMIRSQEIENASP